MRKLTFINLIIASILILASCSTSNNVVSNRLISKRKYTKGYHINKKSDYKASKDVIAEREEIETPTQDVSSTPESSTQEVIETVPVKTADVEVVQESTIAEESSEKSKDIVVTEEHQSENQNLGDEIKRTLSQKEMVNRVKKAAASNSELGDILLIILIIVLIIIVFSFLDAQLGGILGLILAILLIYLILRYFGVI